MSTASTSGLHLKTPHRLLRDAVELLSSMRFAITLLTVIAIASVIGTVLKQNEPYPNYVNQFGPFLGRPVPCAVAAEGLQPYGSC